jgi:enoyl-CoA hydratase/carnithine racemase
MSISTSDKLKVEITGHTALVTIDNPAANTWDTESLPALKALINALNADRSIFALVLTGAGDKFFSAGADLKLFADGNPDTARDMASYFGEGFECLADFRGVSIAAINGFAMGGGLEPGLRHSYSRGAGPDGLARGQGWLAALCRWHPATVVAGWRGLGQEDDSVW